MGAAYQKAMILYSHRRYAEAEVEFGKALAEDPRNEMALAHLALCLASQRKFHRAAEVADLAIEAAPESSFAYYVAATVHNRFGDLVRAKRSARQALTLSPQDSSYFALLASIERRLRNPQDALRYAEEGLRLLPMHKDCGIARAEALVDLGRSEEAAASLSTFLADNPELPHTHAARGVALMAASRPHEALHHFREALRLDPNLASAREGYCEAVKCRNPLYRALSRSLWRMGKSPGAFLIVLITGMFCVLLAAYTGNHDGVRGTSIGFRLGCAAAGLLLWFPVIALLLSEALLRLHPVFRHMMTLRQRIAADATFVMIGAVGVGILTGWLTGKLWLATLLTDVALLGIPLARRLEAVSKTTPPPNRSQLTMFFWGYFAIATFMTGMASEGYMLALVLAGFMTMTLAAVGFLISLDVRGLS
jgi:tetratricopeptide (TPR) repeat protein